MNPLSWIDDELTALEHQKLRRRLLTRDGPQSARLRVDGRELINFGSNDYLGLAADPRLARAAAEAIQHEGFGSGASPLITGHGAAASSAGGAPGRVRRRPKRRLVFSSGFAANAGTIAALVGPGDVVYCDRKNHASLFDGCRLSRADVRVYPHADCRRLASLLAESQSQKYRRRLIVTDGLFSMDGDLAPLAELAELARRHDAMLLVDEAHATGVFGPNGRGVSEHLGVEDGVHVRIGTLSKALGSVGGFVAGSRSLVEWLVNRARPYVFSTAGPAATAAAALAALDIVRDEPRASPTVVGPIARACAMANSVVGQRLEGSRSRRHSQIIPLVLGDPERAVRMSAELRDRGLFVPAIRPPTVPEGEACLRISLTAGHTEEMIAALLTALSLREKGMAGS